MTLNRRNIALWSGVTAIVVLGIVLAAWFTLFRESNYAYKGIETTSQAQPLDLMDQTGQPFSLDDHRGRVVLVYFGYTACPDYCPNTLTNMVSVEDQLGDRAADVDVVMVTVDPERDTPARLTEYLRFFDPGFIGLTGSPEQTLVATRSYGVIATKQDGGSAAGYLVDHSTSLYAIDQEGRLRLTWTYGTDPDDIANDVSHLLDDVIPIDRDRQDTAPPGPCSMTTSLRTIVASVCSIGLLTLDMLPVTYTVTAHDGHDHGTPAGSPEASPVADDHVVANTGTGAVYLTIINTGDRPDRLLGATTSAAQTVEIHTATIDAAGVMSMSPASEGIGLPAGRHVVFEPGGNQLMLVNLTQDLLPGLTFDLTLTFERAGVVSVPVVVQNQIRKDAPAITAGSLSIERAWSRPAPRLTPTG